MRKLNCFAKKVLLAISLFLVTDLNLEAQSTEWVYDCRLDSFISGPVQHIKEGTVLYIKYKKINPFAVKSNPMVTGYTEDFGSANALLENLLTTAVTGSANSDSSNKILTKTTDSLSKTNSQNHLRIGAKAISIGSIQDTVSMSKSNDNSEMIKKLIQGKKNAETQIFKVMTIIINLQMNINHAIALDTVVADAMKDPYIYDSLSLVNRVVSSSLDFDPARPRQTIEMTENALRDISDSIANIHSYILSLQDINARIKRLDQSGNYTFDKEIDSLSLNAAKLTAIYTIDKALKMIKGVTGTILNYEKVANCTFQLPVKKINQISDDVDTVTDNLTLTDGTVFKSIGPYVVYSYGGTRVNVSCNRHYVI